MKNYTRDVLALDDKQLEQFVRDWIGSKTQSYVEVTRFSGPGDRGRDVVGFLSKERHEGPWHNYQCKQYRQSLPTATALCEIGKILYYAFKGEFSPPTCYIFVAPRGVNRNFETLIFNPSQLKNTLISDWGKFCAEKIIENAIIPLDAEFEAFLKDFDFSTFSRSNLDDILNDPAAKPVLVKWFGADPGLAPQGYAPQDIQALELPYINQLVDAYGQREKKVFANHKEIADHQKHIEHLSRQRERFYDADAFKRFYRDNTEQAVIEAFENDIFHGVIDTCDATHDDSLDRVNAVMLQAANVQAAGPLAQHARVPVKQGVCHHFANEERLKWRQ